MAADPSRVKGSRSSATTPPTARGIIRPSENATSCRSFPHDPAVLMTANRKIPCTATTAQKTTTAGTVALIWRNSVSSTDG